MSIHDGARRQNRARRLLFEELERRALLAADFGDAPAPYPTLLAQNGASHEAAGPMLGASRDAEVDGLPAALADGDGADDDGVTFGDVRVGAVSASVTINVQNAPAGAKLSAWVDFDRDGNWGGPGEQIFASGPVVNGEQQLSFAIPASAVAGATFARFRLSTAGGLGFVGPAADGEVEDFHLTIAPPLAGGGQFSPPMVFGESLLTVTSQNPTTLISADLDRDGDVDFVSADASTNALAWRENMGSGQFVLRTIATGVVGFTSASSIAAADVDGDGDLDLLTARADGNIVQVYRGDGHGAFAAPTTIGAGLTTARSVAVGDVNSDGRLDVLAAASGNNTISWFIQDNSGAFNPAPVSTTASFVSLALPADVDRDGDLDVLAIKGTAIVWYANNGVGVYGASQEIVAYSSAPVAFSPVDLDADGRLDVLVANSNSVVWFQQSAAGTFASRSIASAAPRATVAADVDGDGDLDVLSTVNRRVTFHRNDGAQNFTTFALSTDQYSNGIAATDVDGDGRLDIVSTEGYGNVPQIAWRQQLVPSDYGDAPAPYTTTLAQGGARHAAEGPRLGASRDVESDGLSSADATGDGADDDGVEFGVLQIGGRATVIVNVQNAPAGARLSAWIDFNRDGNWGGPGEQIFAGAQVVEGDNELSFAVPTSALSGSTYARFRLTTANGVGVVGPARDGEVEDYAVSVLPPTLSSGLFDPASLVTDQFGAASGVSVVDLDRDGDADVLAAVGSGPGLIWLENQGGGNFASHDIWIPGQNTAVTAADFDNDGDLDVVAIDNGQLRWFENDGLQNFTAHARFGTFGNSNQLYAVDLNGDGWLDILPVSRFAASAGIYINNGDGTFSPQGIGVPATGYQTVAPVDLDRDGDLDFVTHSPFYGGIEWLQNMGGGVFTTTKIVANGAFGHIAAADLDGDGDIDLVAAPHDAAWAGSGYVSAANVTIFANNGSQTFTTLVAAAIPAATSHSHDNPLTLADLDGDGDLDVVTAAPSTATSLQSQIWTLENVGGLGFRPHFVATTQSSAWDVQTGDMDGDGDIDIVASDNQGMVAWYANRPLSAPDIGDAPAPFPTMLAENGAVHVGAGPQLGVIRGADDGVLFSAVQAGQQQATATVNVQNAPAGARLDAWIDFNGDGRWDGPDEQIAAKLAVVEGDNVLSFTVPASSAAGQTYARFRLSTGGGLGVRGFSIDGEVEDFALTILSPTAAAGPYGDFQRAFAASTATAGNGSTVMRLADVNGDGIIDVVGNDQDGTLAWFLNLGDGAFLKQSWSPGFPGVIKDAVPVDFDADGDMDLVGIFGTQLWWLENDGEENFFNTRISPVPTNITGSTIDVADLDGDGDQDVVTSTVTSILVGATTTQVLLWYSSDGQRRYSPRNIPVESATINYLQAGDLDGDGDADLVIGYGIVGLGLVWLENHGSNGFEVHRQTTDDVSDGMLVDLDSDGDLDVVARMRYPAQRLEWYENVGADAFVKHALATVDAGSLDISGRYAGRFTVADVDGDGDQDVVAGETSELRLFRNNGSQTFVPELLAPATETYPGQGVGRIRRVAALDLSGDGRLEVMVTLQTSNAGVAGWYQSDVAFADRFPAISPANTDYNYPSIPYIDGADLLVWQRRLGDSSQVVGLVADWNRDQIVDSLDLDVWEREFGAGHVPMYLSAPPSSTEATVIAASSSSAAAEQTSALDAIFAAGDFTALFQTVRSYAPNRRTRVAMDQIPK